MCGLAGFYRGPGNDRGEEAQTLARMGEAIHHRGPDQGAEWLDCESGIGLSSRRLAIIDLSPAGHQPMHSSSGRFVLSYNGEVYNHLDLRRELEAAGHRPQWRGRSDTETLLAGFETWGLPETLKRAVGMFALALWDRLDRKLTLARDRFGEKPLFYGWQGLGEQRAFLFGSELKALSPHPAFVGEIDRDSLAAYMRRGYVTAPRSIYRGIHKVLPGCVVTVGQGIGEPVLQSYWSGTEIVDRGLSAPLDIPPEEAVSELEQLLERAVAGQLIGDVPIGAFLSGGIDSSAIVALMQRASALPVRTFTIGFEDQRFNEAPFARAVAQHLGTDHQELTISAADALAVVPKLPAIYDEPFADSSQIPTFLISRLARQSVTVALSGDGGDELFAGYERYVHAARLWRRIRNIPRPARAVGAAFLDSIPGAAWNAFSNVAKLERPHSTLADQMAKGAKVLRARAAADIGSAIGDRWDGNAVVIGASSLPRQPPARRQGVVETLMEADLQDYLPDDILVKVDRASMAVSLECRAPYLDHRVAEFAWSLPLDVKMRGVTTKWVLRRLLERHVPRELFDRPKRGFSIPVDEWLRGPLRSWAEELLSPRRLREDGYLRAEPVRRAWEAHLAGRSNHQAALWTVLMFQSWLEARVPAGSLKE
jgi:asparagine synthase (glutamine-hydrolysing)